MLPDPPARLQRAADKGKSTVQAGIGVEWPPRQPPARGVPQYSTLLGIEYQFLLKDKHISHGMLVVYHGHTFRVQGLEDPFATYTVTAGAH